jgi:hypothetical protein
MDKVPNKFHKPKLIPSKMTLVFDLMTSKLIDNINWPRAMYLLFFEKPCSNIDRTQT